MKIQVTQEDINDGEPGTFADCPIARAVKRVSGANLVKVRGVDCQIENTLYILPQIAQDFIENFDHYFPVNPIEFEIK